MRHCCENVSVKVGGESTLNKHHNMVKFRTAVTCQNNYYFRWSVSSNPFGGPACSEVKRVDLMRSGNICSQSSSIQVTTGDITIHGSWWAVQGMTCQGAWDNDQVSSSIWHPGGSGAGASTAIYTGEEIIIHRVTVRQFRVSRLNTSKHVMLLLQFRKAKNISIVQKGSDPKRSYLPRSTKIMFLFTHFSTWSTWPRKK